MSDALQVSTLWDDWRARRDRLAGHAGCEEPYRRVELQLLEYLLRRYRDSPEACRPARFPVGSALVVNDRAILVHHHVFRHAVAGVKSREEAQARMATILRRIAAPAPGTGEAGDEHASEIQADQPRECWSEYPEGYSPDSSTRRLWNKAVDAIRSKYGARQAIARALRVSPYLPRPAVTYLFERLWDLDGEDVDAAKLLCACRNGSALRYAILAWRQRIAAGRAGPVTRRLQRSFASPHNRDHAMNGIRLELSNADALVRLKAIEMLGRHGSLEDLGLLMDLLHLPPRDDEHPEERAALVRAMKAITRR